MYSSYRSLPAITKKRGPFLEQIHLALERKGPLAASCRGPPSVVGRSLPLTHTPRALPDPFFFLARRGIHSFSPSTPVGTSVHVPVDERPGNPAKRYRDAATCITSLSIPPPNYSLAPLAQQLKQVRQMPTTLESMFQVSPNFGSFLLGTLRVLQI